MDPAVFASVRVTWIDLVTFALPLLGFWVTVSSSSSSNNNNNNNNNNNIIIIMIIIIISIM